MPSEIKLDNPFQTATKDPEKVSNSRRRSKTAAGFAACLLEGVGRQSVKNLPVELQSLAGDR